MASFRSLYGFLSSLLVLTAAVTITDIQGPAFQSPLVGQTVSNVIGLVSAKGSSGFYLLGDAVEDQRVSNGIFVFTTSSSILSSVNPGDMITLGSAKVSEFRSASSPNDLFLTELTSPSNIVVMSSNTSVPAVVLGKDRSPPTEKISALDDGTDGFLSVPNNSTLVEKANATLQPDNYGLDFWESLEGQLVQVPSPVALGFPNSFGEFWVRGGWNVSGLNERGGLTLTFGPDGIPDGNPEAIFIGTPLNGADNPDVILGTSLEDITGVVTYQFGFYYILPLVPPVVTSNPDSTVPPTTISSDDACVVTFGDYNVENLAPTSAHLPTIADHITNFLGSPDLVFVQEIQDNSGETNDGVVDANITLSTLVGAIAERSNVTYNFTQINPVDGEDGGVPGGNIRQAYLYNPTKISLASGSTAGGSLDKVEVGDNVSGKPILNFNPGRIDPENGAWNDSRKPLAAEWTTASGETLFTVNVHLSSKGGSSSTQGDARSPVNLPVDQRTSQVSTVAGFVQSILDASPDANVIVAGDFNEFTQTRSVFSSLSSILHEIEDVANVPFNERYTYVFDQDSEQLDHVFISKAFAQRGDVKVEHVHVNTWAASLAQRVSDHDPSAFALSIC